MKKHLQTGRHEIDIKPKNMKSKDFHFKDVPIQ